MGNKVSRLQISTWLHGKIFTATFTTCNEKSHVPCAYIKCRGVKHSRPDLKKNILPTRDFIKLCGRWTLENSTSEWNLVSDLVYALWEGREWAETLTKQWPGKWCRQGAFVCRDKAGDAGPGQERETDRARGQGNVVESPQGLLGKCSWMTAFWNVHKWRVLIG